MNKNLRKGKGYSWSMVEHTALGTRETSGFTIDNLDKKQLADAENEYEKTFVLVRKTLESLDSFCLDDEGERLQCAQDIADVLHGRKYD